MNFESMQKFTPFLNQYPMNIHFLQGVRICGNRRTNHVLHVIWALILATAGMVQMVAGIYFMMELPIFSLGSNIWTGAWVNVILRDTKQSISSCQLTYY